MANNLRIARDCTATIGERRATILTDHVLGHALVAVQVKVTMPSDALGVSTLDVGIGDARLLEDTAATGAAIDLARSRYEISEPMRRWVTARDRTCRFPGCRRRSTACQFDHIDAWDDDGRTDAANLDNSEHAPLLQERCRR